jgi:hypothetical protein
VHEQRAALDQEVQRTRAELSSLQHELDFFEHPGSGMIPATSSSGIFEYQSMLISNSTIEAVIRDNKERKIQSEGAPHPQYRNLTDLPGFWNVISAHKSKLSVLFSAQITYQLLMKERQEALAKVFCERQAQSVIAFRKIDEYAAKVTGVGDDTLSEDSLQGKPKSDSPEVMTPLFAMDQPMLLSKAQQMAGCYYDMNGFVPDPQAEFDEYRARISWSDEEKRKFIVKYSQYGKNFHLIASSLPLKSVKDVIEFYWLNLHPLNLKEKEIARRKRGGKKRFISEGSRPVSRGAFVTPSPSGEFV